MIYNVNDFFIRVSQSDSLLHLRDTNNNIQYTINAFDISSSFVSNNLLKINTKSEYIQLDFGNSTLSKIALFNLQNEIKSLRKKTPVVISTDVKNWVISYVNNNTNSAYLGTSSTLMQIPDIGHVVSFQTQPNLAYTPFQSAIVSTNTTFSYVYDWDVDYINGDEDYYFIGHLNSYNMSDGTMTLVVDYANGFGLTDSGGSVPTFSFWYVNLSGDSRAHFGATGPAGPTGTNGLMGFTGSTGPQGTTGSTAEIIKYDRVSPINGGSVTISDGKSLFLNLNAYGTINDYTVYMPPNPIDGQVCHIIIANDNIYRWNITNLNILPNVSQYMDNAAPTSSIWPFRSCAFMWVYIDSTWAKL